MIRLRLAQGLFFVLLAGAFVLGQFASGPVRNTLLPPGPLAVSLVPLSDVLAQTNLPHDLLPAQYLLAADGNIFALDRGYQSLQADAVQTKALFATVRQQMADWDNEYLLAQHGIRVEIRLLEPTNRIIVIDDPLTNPNLPPGLYALIGAMVRPMVNGTTPTAFAPPIRVKAIPLEAALDWPVYGPPAGFPFADALAGLSLNATQQQAFLTEWHVGDTDWWYPTNVRVVRNEDSLYLLAFIADWSAWLTAH